MHELTQIVLMLGILWSCLMLYVIASKLEEIANKTKH